MTNEKEKKERIMNSPDGADAWKERCLRLQRQVEHSEKAHEQISGDLYELSRQVIEAGRSKPLKLALLLKRFRDNPPAAAGDLFARVVKKAPIETAPFALLEETIYRIHLNLENLRNNSFDAEEEEKELLRRLSSGGYRGIWIIGSLDMGWHETFKQRHHHLADYLMKCGYLVFCAMNPAFQRDVTSYIRREQENLYLVNFNDRGKRDAILRLLIQNSKAPLFYSLMPTEPGTTIEDIRFLQSAGVTVYYDYFDELSKDIYPGVTPQHFERHQYLLDNPEVLICATSENLYRKAAGQYPERVILSKNGVRLEDWQIPEGSKIPPEMKPVLARGGKIIGFYGSFAPWLDYDMFKELAQKRPDYSIVMIGYDYEWGKGAFAASGLAKLPNVFIIPAQKYDNLKYFARHFDVGVVPFRIYELTVSVSPVKMFEYMAQGIPIVTSAMPECRLYRSCLIAETPEDFVKKIDEALKLRNDAEYQAIQKKEAAENTWETIAGRIMDFVEKSRPACSKTPVLTIAVPTYNMEQYLPELIERLLYPPILADTEVIIVNDGSSDGSLKMAREYSRKYPDSIRVIDKPNGGHGSCINAGIAAARGTYFKLVDADDYLEPMALIRHLNLLKKSDCDMVICDYRQFFTDGSTAPVSYRDRLEEKSYSQTELIRALHVDNIHLSYAHMHAITYRTGLLRDNKIAITEKSFYVDQEYIAYPFPFVRSICYQPMELYYYRLGRPGQSMDPAVIRKKLWMNHNILQNLQRFLLNAGEGGDELKHYLLNIIYHHSFFFLTYTDESEKFSDLMAWWSEGIERRKYQRLLLLNFSSSLNKRDRRIRQLAWSRKYLPGWRRRLKNILAGS